MNIIKDKANRVNSITLQQIKKQLNIEESFSEDDQYLIDLLDVATVYVEDEIGCDVLLTQNTVTLDDISGSKIRVDEGEFNTLSFVGVNGEDLYGCTVKKEHNHFIINLPKTVVDSDVVYVLFSTGYDSIPTPIKQAILIKISDLYDVERNDKIIGVSVNSTRSIDSLIRTYKRKYW